MNGFSRLQRSGRARLISIRERGSDVPALRARVELLERRAEEQQQEIDELLADSLRIAEIRMEIEDWMLRAEQRSSPLDS